MWGFFFLNTVPPQLNVLMNLINTFTCKALYLSLILLYLFSNQIQRSKGRYHVKNSETKYC